MATDNSRYLTAEEVAERYRISVGALHTQRHRGQAPGVLALKVGRRLLWRPSHLDAWEDGKLRREGVTL